MYTHVVPRPPDEAPRSTVANQWDLLAPLGLEPPDPVLDPLEMEVDATASASVDRRLKGAGVSAAHPVVVIHVSAGNPFRRWPPEAFEALVVTLAIAGTTARVWLGHRRQRELIGPATLLVTLVAVQIVLGAFTVWSRRAVWINSAHVASGALVLATSLVLTLRSWRLKFATDTVRLKPDTTSDLRTVRLQADQRAGA